MAHVLVAEPDYRVANFVAGILADCGHAVALCDDAEKATATLGADAVDLVVTDLALSGGGGGALRQSCAGLGIPLITLSGCELRPGGRAIDRPLPLIDKPFRFTDLRRVLDAAKLTSGAACGPAIVRDAA